MVAIIDVDLRKTQDESSDLKEGGAPQIDLRGGVILHAYKFRIHVLE